MRLLVLGGTVFLSRAVAAEAVRRGHEVTCACRGTSGSVPEGATLVEVDRTAARCPRPRRVRRRRRRRAAAVLGAGRGGGAPRRALGLRLDRQRVRRRRDPRRHARDAAAARADPRGRRPEGDPEAYGPMKVACEQLVLDGAASSMVIRPGLIVGPEDPTGRFSYWPRRLAAGGEVLAPGDPGDAMQVVDVRDLAAWVVDRCEQRTHRRLRRRRPVHADGRPARAVRRGRRRRASPGRGSTRSSSPSRTSSRGWGRSAIPLWLPRPEYDGLPRPRRTALARRRARRPPARRDHPRHPGLAGGRPRRPGDAASTSTARARAARGLARPSGVRLGHMTRLVPGVAAGALALGLSVAVSGPAHAGQLKTCNDYIKAKNISCTKASSVAEQGLARLLDRTPRGAVRGLDLQAAGPDDRKFRAPRRLTAPRRWSSTRAPDRVRVVIVEPSCNRSRPTVDRRARLGRCSSLWCRRRSSRRRRAAR